ncbi:MAG: glycosyltransferase [Deltaproteobacteria bacterium]|nr:glycosyltransferase [Deltaproteobacteria bacterium]
MTGDPIGGVWQYALELCRQLGKAETEIALATMGRPLTAQERGSIDDLPHVRLFESAYKLEWMREPGKDLEAAGHWLLDLESRLDPSLIHLNQYCHGALPWKVPCLVVGHSCVYSWFEAVKATPPGAEWEDYRQAVQAGLHRADLVTAPSRTMLSALETHYGRFAAAPPIYNGRSGAFFAAEKKEPCIVTAGRLWDEAKNIASLRSIAGKIPWPLYVAGEWRNPDGEEARLDGLIPLGQLDSGTLAHWFNRAAIFVLPARYEPFGLSALEAGLAGCALVLGDIASLREIWGEAAVFVPPGDPEKILIALLKLIADPSLRQEFARRARRRALAFTPERMAQAYMQIYEKLRPAATRPIAERYLGE